MNKFINIILVGEWDGYHRKGFVTAVADKISDWSDTLLIHSPLSLFIHVFIKFKKRFLSHLRGDFKPKIINNSIQILTPVIIFHYVLWQKLPLLAYIDSYLMKIQIERYVRKKYSDKKIILWVTIPVQIYLTNILKYDYLVYDSFDDNELDYSGNILENEYRLNRELIKKTDLTITLARYTYKKFSLVSDKSVYIPNANSFHLYSKKGDAGKAKELAELDKPVIGYLGNIRNWIDFKLIKYILDKNPDVYLVFIGLILRSARTDMADLKKYRNFIHIDFLSVDKIPGYLNYFDVGIIPFKVNNFTSSVFPNKFFEYMAAEIPIVTTALPELEEYSQYVGYSKTEEEFSDFCNKAIKGEFKKLVENYKDLASKNDWSLRAEKVNQYLLNIVNIS